MATRRTHTYTKRVSDRLQLLQSKKQAGALTTLELSELAELLRVAYEQWN